MSLTEASSKRVVVAMSGGVDSSVAAALLVQQGYQVIGMMLRLWNEPGSEADNRCCTPDAMAMARRVAARLGIPFYAIDAQASFRETVVEAFLQGYLQGHTPNPCLVCNRQIRWGFLLGRARLIGASYMATGHYVRLTTDAEANFHLHRAVDTKKDQSYVLHMLTQAQLAQALFPLGGYAKPEIRQLARDFKLPVAERTESQDLCFLGDQDYRAFLLRNAPQSRQPGPIMNLQRKIIGEHQGLSLYTIGQRKGLGIASSVPLYVLEKELATNALIVGKQDELGKDHLTAAEFTWINGVPPTSPFRAQVQIRYKAQPAWATIEPKSATLVNIQFDQHLRDITPGQAAVIYSGNECLGGGIIQVGGDQI